MRDVAWIDDDNIIATLSGTSAPPFGFVGARREWFQLVNFNVSKLKLGSLSFVIDHVETFNVIDGGWTMREVEGHHGVVHEGILRA